MIKSQLKLSNLTLQLVSLLMALLLWFYFSWREGNVQQQFRIFPSLPLIHKNKPANMKLTSDNYRIQVQIYGSQKELDQLTINDIGVSLDLEEFGSGTYNFPLDKNNVTLPNRLKSLTIGEVLPNSVSLTLREMTTKTLTMFMATKGEPAKNFEITDLILKPDKVTIEGPTELIKNLTVLVADSVDVSGATGNVSGRVQFDFKNQVPKDTVIQGLSALYYEVIIVEKTTSKRPARTYPLDIPATDRHDEAQFDVKLVIEGPISAVEWFDPQWVLPTSKPAVQEPQPEDGPDSGQAGNKITYDINYLINMPQEVRTEHPDWEAKVNKLVFKWKPATVEVAAK